VADEHADGIGGKLAEEEDLGARLEQQRRALGGEKTWMSISFTSPPLRTASEAALIAGLDGAGRPSAKPLST